MANETAMIEGKCFHNPATGKLERVEFKWVGKSRRVRVSGELVDQHGWIIPEKKIRFGPYTLAVLERDWMRDDYLCQRIDNIFSWVPVLWHKTSRVLELAYRRFIVTLAIWGLAKYDPGYIPNASQIYLVQKVRKLWQMIIAR